MDNISFYLDKSIEIELNIAELYKIFFMNFQEDYEFWWNLYIEEINHASLLKSGKDFLKVNKFPKDLLLDNIDDLSYTNNKILSYIDYFKENQNRETAFKIALDVESSAAELHFENFMKQNSDNIIINIFKKLNGFDINHYNRIKKYIEDKNIYYLYKIKI